MLSIVEYPDPVLRARAKPVERVTDEVRAVAEKMINLMYDAKGIGLAAPQVGLSWRLFVVDVPEGADDEDEGEESSEPVASGGLPEWTDGPVVYVNPVLVNPEGPIEPYEEGCLSLPEIRGVVNRPPTITIEAIGLDGKAFRQRATGLLARCWQHEMDHLDGVLILDRMTQAARLKNRAKVRDLERSAEPPKKK